MYITLSHLFNRRRYQFLQFLQFLQFFQSHQLRADAVNGFSHVFNSSVRFVKQKMRFIFANRAEHKIAIQLLLLSLVGALLSGCGGALPAPVSEADGEWIGHKRNSQKIHVVIDGETLASIALDNGLDYRDIALWNGIANPNLIHPGDELVLTAPENIPETIALAGVTESVASGLRPLQLQPIQPAQPINSNIEPSITSVGSAEQAGVGNINQGEVNSLANANNIGNSANAGTSGFDSAGNVISNITDAGQAIAANRAGDLAAKAAAASVVAAVAKPLAEGLASGALSSGENTQDNGIAPASVIAPTKSGPSAAVYPYSDEKLRELQQQQRQAVQQPQIVDANVEIAKAQAPSNSPKQIRERYGVQWSWPSHGTVTRKYNSVSKGIDFAGRRGDSVFATADGKVVYVGTGVKSYGRLVIIKHDNNYLSAYAHNEDVRVKEGQQVRRGDFISTFGDSGADQVMLHLEIRKAGKPINPMDVLPPSP